MTPLRITLALSLGANLWLLHAQTGVVRANGVPVPGATVKATQGGKTFTTVAGDDGQYKLDGITGGSWNFEVQMFRFETMRKEVQVQGASNLEWSLALRPLTAPAAPVQARGPRGPSPDGT
jgi:Carboxypeptidase regulatory-like domain